MSGEFVPSHVAPDGGMRAWAEPDPAGAVITTIEARVEMQVLELRGDWAHIQCSNGWSAWVDARELVSKHAAPPPAPVAQPAAVAAPQPVAPVVQLPKRSNLPDALTRQVFSLSGRNITVADLIGPVGIVLGALMPWFKFLGGSTSSFDVPLLFLLDNSPTSDALKLAWLLVACAGAALFAPDAKLRQIGLGVAGGVTVIFVVQVQRLISASGAPVSLFDVVGFGALLTLIAAGAGFYLARTNR